MHRLLMAGSILIGVLAGCRTSEERRVAGLLEADPAPSRFSICHGNSCRLRTDVALSAEEWAQIAALFDPPPADALA